MVTEENEDTYRTVLASSVGDIDGMALELCTADGQVIASVFEDGETGMRTVTMKEATVDLALMEWFLAEARRRL